MAIATDGVISFRFLGEWNRQYRKLWLGRARSMIFYVQELHKPCPNLGCYSVRNGLCMVSSQKVIPA
jgi:hypothetical protein